MPRLDGTGPMGNGPRSGRGLGFCNPDRTMNDSNMPSAGQYAGFGRGMGLRRGMGRGLGMGRGRQSRYGRGKRR
ncbi:MAG: DUF5320 domain-containing protein [Deltaproteobacteria bacterium]|nr:DUF5320 domain-containing protein [Deltaproteobacteria bacterium]MBW1928748.1 DUF5320 domain-containing protein [Deltaproteobacteria bacterium]MBW2024999.1 DUF5320 domain-containing protein [Deltaproteobacteria bacterium]MBW2124120.1 DUF5320 domain-containing protein [Deltaproteobacteria bacterium]RLB24450.1 MAG: hypothetical protein DRG76_01450 [Deltaproteobacteria bacterium]